MCSIVVSRARRLISSIGTTVPPVDRNFRLERSRSAQAGLLRHSCQTVGGAGMLVIRLRAISASTLSASKVSGQKVVQPARRPATQPALYEALWENGPKQQKRSSEFIPDRLFQAWPPPSDRR